jgi:hypothetical protein
MGSVDQILGVVLELKEGQGELLSEIRTARKEREDCEERALKRCALHEASIKGIQVASNASSTEIQTWKTQGTTFRWTVGIFFSAILFILGSIVGALKLAKEFAWIH